MTILSCTVIEDRDDCPSCLSIDLSAIEKATLLSQGVNAIILDVGNEEESAEVVDTLSLVDCPSEYVALIPRGNVFLLAVGAPDGEGYSIDDGLIIKSGYQCPRCVMFSETFSIEKDTFRKTVHLHKNWCTLNIHLKHSTWSVPQKYIAAVDGNVCGYDKHGVPRTGEFKCQSPSSASGDCVLTIPRQVDASMKLHLSFLESNELRSFPLGEMIWNESFDWNSADLDDIYVEIDFSASNMDFTINAWKQTLSFELKI